jgi:hypothetical protein
MNSCCDTDSCIIDDEPWDCACYSHNPEGDIDHEKNPAFRGMDHHYVLQHQKELLVWNPESDGYMTKAYLEWKKGVSYV